MVEFDLSVMGVWKKENNCLCLGLGGEGSSIVLKGVYIWMSIWEMSGSVLGVESVFGRSKII